MSRVLARTVDAIAECEAHLRATSMFGTSIEAYLTQYLLVLLCADMEQELCASVRERGSRPGDVKLANYAATTVARVIRGIKKTEIATLANYFGPDVQAALNASLDERIVALYGNAVTNRHQVAHAAGVNITFGDLKDATAAAQAIIAAFENAIQ